MRELLRKLLTRSCLNARETAIVDRFVSKVFQIWYDLPFSPYYLAPRHDIGEIFRHCYGLPFPPTHYYSPLPDLPALKKKLARWYKESSSPGIDWNLGEQIELAEKIAQYAHELGSLPTFAQVTQGGYGQGYGEVEAHVLYMMMRHLRPSAVVEVGSGVSTFYTLSALRMTREKDGVAARMTCVDPYPSGKLRELVSERHIQLRACEVQDIEFGVFQELSANDVLFIDSSHVSKKDSDVDFLYLEVMPRLREGVVVHIHDMPFPMPTVPQAHPLFDTFLFWNSRQSVSPVQHGIPGHDVPELSTSHETGGVEETCASLRPGRSERVPGLALATEGALIGAHEAVVTTQNSKSGHAFPGSLGVN